MEEDSKKTSLALEEKLESAAALNSSERASANDIIEEVPLAEVQSHGSAAMVRPISGIRRRLMRMSVRKGETAKNVFLMCMKILVFIICILPFYWSILTALKPADKILSSFDLLPRYVTFDNFAKAFANPLIWEGLKNTLIVTLLTMVINILFSLLAGYAFARLDFAGKGIVFKIMLTSMMLPFAVVFMPTFLVLARFPLVGGNNIFGQGGYGFTGPSTMIFGIVLPSAVSVYNIFFLRQFFLTLPNELAESARLDGAGEFRIFFSIYLPLIQPALASLAVFTFQAGWNNYFWPNILSQGQFMVLTMVLRTFYQGLTPDHGAGMAFTLVVTLPMLLIFIFFQRYFMKGISVAGMKE